MAAAILGLVIFAGYSLRGWQVASGDHHPPALRILAKQSESVPAKRVCNRNCNRRCVACFCGAVGEALENGELQGTKGTAKY